MSHLAEEDTARLEALRKERPFVEATLRQVKRILASERFQRCQENSRGFLEYVVAMQLLGETDTVKELTIARYVFKPHPRQAADNGSLVRECARTLRERLKAFYRHEGRHDPIRISIPKGTYIPDIRDRRRTILVTPFLNWNPAGDQGHLCEAITEEIVHRLSLDSRFVVRKVPSLIGEPTAYCGLQGLLVSFGGEDVKLCYCFVNFRRRYTSITQVQGCRDELLKLGANVSSSVMTLATAATSSSTPVKIVPRRQASPSYAALTTKA